MPEGQFSVQRGSETAAGASKAAIPPGNKPAEGAGGLRLSFRRGGRTAAGAVPRGDLGGAAPPKKKIPGWAGREKRPCGVGRRGASLFPHLPKPPSPSEDPKPFCSPTPQDEGAGRAPRATSPFPRTPSIPYPTPMPTRTRITLTPSLSDHHRIQSAEEPLTLRLSKGEPGGGSRRGLPYRGGNSFHYPPSSAQPADFPIYELPPMLRSSACPSAGFVQIRPICAADGSNRPATAKLCSKLDPRSKAHSIDAIPSCAHFTAYQFPKLRRGPSGTGPRKNAFAQFKSIQTPGGST